MGHSNTAGKALQREGIPFEKIKCRHKKRSCFSVKQKTTFAAEGLLQNSLSISHQNTISKKKALRVIECWQTYIQIPKNIETLVKKATGTGC